MIFNALNVLIFPSKVSIITKILQQKDYGMTLGDIYMSLIILWRYFDLITFATHNNGNYLTVTNVIFLQIISEIVMM